MQIWSFYSRVFSRYFKVLKPLKLRNVNNLKKNVGIQIISSVNSRRIQNLGQF